MAMQRSSGDDRGNLQIIVVNLNGNNLTIQEAIKGVHNMIRRDGGASSIGQSELTNGKRPKGLPKNGDVVQPPEEPTLFVDADAGSDEEEERVAPTPTPPSGPKKFTVPKVIADLDLNSATPTFRDFVEEKKPEDQFDWYLLVASWMKDHKAVEEISIHHAYTASRYIGAGWSLPEDVGQPFRDGRRKGFFVKGSKAGLSKITHIGEDRVKRMGLKS